MNPWRIRRAALGLALSLALVVPGTALAASTSGTTPESLDIASTVSMTVPTSITYTQGKALNAATVTLTNLDTDNATGMRVELDVNAAAAFKITPASRSLADGTIPAGWSGPGNLAAPFTTGGSAQTVIVADYPNNNPSSHTLSFISKVNASAYIPGSYTGSLHFTAMTN